MVRHLLLCIQLGYKQKMIQDQSVDDLIHFTITTFSNIDETERIKELLVSTISHLVLLYFNKMDKLLESFAEKWGNYVLEGFRKINWGEDETDHAYLNAFEDLLLSNTQYFHEKFFPTVNIQGIKTRLAVQLLMDGKYFRLIEKNLSQDLTFHFE
jgi:hypothetical protein